MVFLPRAVPGACGLMSATVFTESEAKENTAPVVTDELSLYDIPVSQLRYEEPKAGHVEQGVAALRRTLEPYISWYQSYYQTVEPGVNVTQNTVKDIYTFLNNPPPVFFSSVGAIGFSGILGLYFAKGSTVKRLIFPSALMALSASMFYPQHAASVARAKQPAVLEVLENVAYPQLYLYPGIWTYARLEEIQAENSMFTSSNKYIYNWGSEGWALLEELLKGKSPSKDKLEKTPETESQKSS
ncbi:hypothetical protein DNTS_022341 [Danionella cerebrum]|uniref:MICOS complex subunit n=1 Tax=Danionella cerebrum TaxID=2873325 RepID=A0A553N067_9TELE|nr:hypothetical protein DNTS_022341 [Danionella translucida]